MPEASIEAPSSSDYSAGSHDSVAEETPAQQFTWNEDPKKINDMLRSLNPDSAEWVVWKDWADFLEEERERMPAERKAAAATAQLVSSGSGPKPRNAEDVGQSFQFVGKTPQ
ncbi:hypothetical protein SLS56_003177 [Neofusicoccum ribis]|uniref:Uncharacterized protein n=1 Tax=Neofusicoccum ribis TaxID=45134 RepID=A0ABR3T1Y0_9PEZI